MGNVDKTVYHNTADHNIPLSPLGLDQASAAGQFFKNRLIIKEQNGLGKGSNKATNQIRVWASPYVRTRQTSHQILASMGCKWDKFLYGTTMARRCHHLTPP
jgi:phosphohistidine phosphatase SixA